MQALNFPEYQFRIKNSENKLLIFDELRKKFVILQPEEWVRQHVSHYLRYEKKYPASLMNVEKQIKINDMVKRYDLVVFNKDGSVHLVVECKAPEIVITQDTFDQIARYNLNLHASYLMVTNGLNSFYCQLDYQNEKYIFLKDIPSYKH
jgi:hypothetical protein